MLEKMRENKSSFIINFVIGLIVVVFVFWTGSPGSGYRPNFIASVNGVQIQEITFARAVGNQLEQARRFSQKPASKSEELAIRQRVLDGLIDEELLRQEVKRLGIAVSDAELQAEILNNPNLKDENGKFDAKRYKKILSRYPLFEQDERERLQLQKLDSIIRALAVVSDADIKAAFEAQNARVTFDYLKLTYDTFGQQVTVTPEERTAFLKDRAAEVKVRYDADYDRLYNIPKKVRARHILLKYDDSDTPELKASLRAKMEAIKARAATEDFSSLALEFSEDPGSTLKGGDLGLFDEKRMDAAFSAAAFALSAGQLSDIVESRFGLHIIKVEEVQEAQVKALADVQDQIAETLIKEEKGPELARKAADDLKTVWSKGGQPLDDKVKGLGLNIETTAPSGRTGDMVRGIGNSKELADVAFALTADAPTPENYFTVGDAFVFIRLKERTGADMATYEASKDRLKGQAQREKEQKIMDAWKADLRARAKIEVGAAPLSVEDKT